MRRSEGDGDGRVAAPPQPPFPVGAVLFDLDGLLVDTEPCWERAERRIIAELGGRWDPALRGATLGRGPEDAAAVLAAHLDGADPAMVDRRLLVAALEEFRRGVAPRPGAHALLSAMTGHLPLAVATNARRVLADTALVSAGLDALVQTMVCVEDVAYPKPAPDVYRRACAELGVDAGVVVAFEDSPTGAAAALAAGCWVVACPSEPGVTVPEAHASVASLTEVDPAVLLDGRR